MKPKPTKNRIRVLLADDHLIVRQGICSTFENHPKVSIIDQAANGADAVAKARALSPDVVLMDWNMPVMNGMEATAAIHEQLPHVKVLVLTVHDSREYVVKILRSGAQGYVLKDASPDELCRAIEAVHQGGAFFSPSVAKIVLQDLVGSSDHPKNSASSGLSERENEVLKLIVNGSTTKEIARQMNVGVRTVETYRTRLMRKLNVRNAAELTRTAIAQQLISLA